MPDTRLQRTRETLPVGYQFGDAKPTGTITSSVTLNFALTSAGVERLRQISDFLNEGLVLMR
jgi:hypothetical protein